MLAVFGMANAGCSFIFTKGPQPEVQPPPPCTTSNTVPTVDAVIGGLGVVALVAGVVVAAEAASQPCSGFGCAGEGAVIAAGGGGALLGVVGAAVFIPSAIVGFNRTAACRASLEAKPQQPASPSPPQSSLLLVPPHGCPTAGGAPRMCSSAPPWGPSAVLLKEAPH